jgi:hypothetical protein
MDNGGQSSPNKIRQLPVLKNFSLVNLTQMWRFADSLFADQILFSNLRIWDSRTQFFSYGENFVDLHS